jgi:hypothetical protein
MAAVKIAGLDQQIAQLMELRDWLSATVASWNARLERTPSGKRAGLLESLAGQGFPTNRQSKGNNHETNRSHVRSEPHPRRIRANGDELPHARSKRF